MLSTLTAGVKTEAVDDDDDHDADILRTPDGEQQTIIQVPGSLLSLFGIKNDLVKIGKYCSSITLSSIFVCVCESYMCGGVKIVIVGSRLRLCVCLCYRNLWRLWRCMSVSS